MCVVSCTLVLCGVVVCCFAVVVNEFLCSLLLRTRTMSGSDRGETQPNCSIALLGCNLLPKIDVGTVGFGREIFTSDESLHTVRRKKLLRQEHKRMHMHVPTDNVYCTQRE